MTISVNKNFPEELEIAGVIYEQQFIETFKTTVTTNGDGSVTRLTLSELGLLVNLGTNRFVKAILIDTTGKVELVYIHAVDNTAGSEYIDLLRGQEDTTPLANTLNATLYTFVGASDMNALVDQTAELISKLEGLQASDFTIPHDRTRVYARLTPADLVPRDYVDTREFPQQLQTKQLDTSSTLMADQGQISMDTDSADVPNALFEGGTIATDRHAGNVIFTYPVGLASEFGTRYETGMEIPCRKYKINASFQFGAQWHSLTTRKNAFLFFFPAYETVAGGNRIFAPYKLYVRGRNTLRTGIDRKYFASIDESPNDILSTDTGDLVEAILVGRMHAGTSSSNIASRVFGGLGIQGVTEIDVWFWNENSTFIIDAVTRLYVPYDGSNSNWNSYRASAIVKFRNKDPNISTQNLATRTAIGSLDRTRIRFGLGVPKLPATITGEVGVRISARMWEVPF